MLNTNRLFAAAAASFMLLTAALPTMAQDSAGLNITVPYPNPWPLKSLVKEGTLTIATTGKTDKVTFIDETGTLAGARIDLWTKIAQDLGLAPEFVVLDWAGVLPGLAANRFDIACEGASWTLERLGSPDFYMTRPIEVVINVGMVLKDSGITTWADVAGKRLGGVRGEQELKDLVAKVGGDEAAGELLELPGVTEARLALLNGQFDVFAVGRAVAETLLEGPDGDKFAIISEPTKVGLSGFCVNKNEGDLAQAVNVLIAKYRADGTLKAMSEKWGRTDASAELALLGY